MKVWKRKKTHFDQLNDRYLNSFYKGNFINDKIYTTKDRDIWYSFVDLLSDVNTSSIFSSILIAYKEIPYSEAMIQSMTLGDTGEYRKNTEKLNKATDTYANIEIINSRFYDCVFIKSPMSSAKINHRKTIMNTLQRLKTDFPKYTVVKHVVQFLKNQIKILNDDILESQTDDLFLKSTIKLLVPMLHDGKYYYIEGIRYYPFLTDAYHYNKTRQLNQIKFIFKCWHTKEGRYRKFPGYFDKGQLIMSDGSKGPELLYCKFFRQFYNPFLLFDKEEIDLLMEDLRNSNLSQHTMKLLNNNYENYIQTLESTRKELKNRIPNILIHKPNDSYYDDLLEEQQFQDHFQNMVDADDSDADEVVVEEVPEETNEEEEEEVPYTTVSRKMLSVKTLKSLIMGYNGFKYFGFYSHIGDVFLDFTKMDVSTGNKSRGIGAKDTTRAHQVYMTIKSNTQLFKSGAVTNPIDVYELSAYSKTIQPDNQKLKGVPGARQKVNREDRFNTWDEYGVLDTATVKSPDKAGLVSVCSPLLIFHDHYKFRD